MKSNRELSLTLENQPDDKELNSILRKCKRFDRIKITVSYASPSSTLAGCDLSFLTLIPKLSDLRIDYAYNQKDYGFISSLIELEYLRIYGLPKPLSMRFLTSMSKLRFLEIEKQGKDFEYLAELSNLKTLRLHSVKVPSFDWITSLKNLTALYLTLTTSEDYGSLVDSKLKILKLWDLRLTNNIAWIENFSSLEKLGLWELKNVARLPSFKKLTSLHYIELFGMKMLHDLSPLLEAEALEEICCKDAIYMKAEDFIPLSKHPRLRRGNIHLKSDKENERLKEILKLDYSISRII